MFPTAGEDIVGTGCNYRSLGFLAQSTENMHL